MFGKLSSLVTGIGWLQGSALPHPGPALDKARTRRVSTAAPPCQIVKPKPLRAWAIPPPEPITVMTAVVPPLPDAQQLRKGILKPPRPATAVPSEMNSSTTHHSHHRSSRPQSVAPPPSPPLRCSKSSLHWQLCPPIEYPTILFPAKKRLSKHILFDVSMPPSCIAFRDVEDAGVVLRGSAAREYTYRHARTGKPLYEMILRCDKIPDLAIRVKAKHGDVIRCRDVYEAIYKSLDRVMSPEELVRYRTGRNFARCEEAFERRCQRIHRGVPSVERAQGMRLVDLLEGDTYFLGLKTPPIGSPLDLEGKVWFVNFGPEPQIIDLNNL
ncbi:hypothetical protein BN946_scf184884.g30 [Trametes cinnabarina]|uniref:DUF6699 domain-containing protein n=1 Tax=Pycnoporus cinnabarinus TaxID=5643 RepID=A0A060S6Q3_PYCCI|nr:hypothetical protein BN946_scf184884.g30 [Trametes cinnabarina]